MEELWLPIKGYEDRYHISNYGRVKRIASVHQIEIIMRQRIWHGYMEVHFRLKGFKKKMRVHRLVANEFIPNPEDKPIVNHLDGNRSNNVVSNLEWATDSENVRHGYARRKELEISKTDIPF